MTVPDPQVRYPRSIVSLSPGPLLTDVGS
jgi:hypothetical protein